MNHKSTTLEAINLLLPVLVCQHRHLVFTEGHGQMVVTSFSVPELLQSWKLEKNQCCGSASFCCLPQIRISILVPTQIRIRIGTVSKQCWSSCGSYPKFYTCRKTRTFFILLFTALPDYNVNLFYQCQMCHNYQYFWHNIEIFWGKKVNFINFLILLGLDTDPDRHARIPIPNPDPDKPKWCETDPIRIRIHNS